MVTAAERQAQLIRSARGGVDQSEDKSEGIAQEFLEGMASGVIGIGEGIVELGALGIDLIADTSYAQDVREGAEAVRETLGIDPEGMVGKGVEAVVQLGIPGLAAVGAVSKISRLGRLKKVLDQRNMRILDDGKLVAKKEKSLTAPQRFALGAQQLTAAGLADAAVATNNLTTIGDLFDDSPTSRDLTTGLTGREEAARIMLNRAKFGVEGAAAFVAAPYVIKGVSTVAAPVLSPVAKGAKIAAEPIARKAKALEDEYTSGAREQMGTLSKLAAQTMASVRFRGFLPDFAGQLRSLVPGLANAEIKKADILVRALDKDMDKVAKTLAKEQKRDSKLLKTEMQDTIEAWMLAPKAMGDDGLKATDVNLQEAFDMLPDVIKPTVNKMRDQVDRLSNEILNSSALQRRLKSSNKATREAAEEVETIIQGEMHKYMRRRYKIHEDPNYRISPELEAKALRGFQDDVTATLNEIKSALRSGDKDLVEQAQEFVTTNRAGDFVLKTRAGVSSAGPKVPEDAALFARDRFIERHTPQSKPASKKTEGRAAIERLDPNIFTSRKRLTKFQRELLGEIKGPQENFMATVSDLATFKSVDNYFGGIRRSMDAGDAGTLRLFKDDPGGRSGRRQLEAQGFVQLKGPQYGALEDVFVPEPVFNNMTRVVRQADDSVIELAKKMYSGFLYTKGMSQYSKTILSPITQVRNVTTASFFALAQGNVGAGASLGESVNLVFQGLKRLPPERQAAELAELMELGVIGTQAQLQEIKQLLKTGFGTSKQYASEAAGEVGEQYIRRREAGKLGNFFGDVANNLKGVTGKAEDLYQGGDDVWKIYNFNAELSKLKKVFSQMDETTKVDQLSKLTGRAVEDISDNPAIIARLKGIDVSEVTRTGEGFRKALRREAADIVRNNVPNYSLAPEAIRGLRRLPIGNFIAFPYEIYRTGFNTIGRGLTELASDNKEIQQIGLRRLSGALTTFTVLPTALATAAYEFSGVSEKEMKAFQRQFAYPWQKNSLLIPTGKTKEGVPTYIDFSYSNPYDQLARGARAALTAYETGMEEGKSGDQIAAEIGFETLNESFKPFIESSIMSEKLQDIFIRDGKMKTGALIYNPGMGDTAGTKVAKSFMHLADGVLPGAIPLNIRGGVPEPSRFLRGLAEGTGDDTLFGVTSLDKSKRQFTLTGELSRAFTGMTEIEPKLDDLFKFKSAAFGKERRLASNIFNRVADDANATPDQLFNAYVKADEARYRVYNKLYQTVEDLREMGFSEREIRRNFKVENIDVSRVMRNKYEPLEVASVVKSEMRDLGTFTRTFRNLSRNYYRSRRNIPFKSSVELEQETSENTLFAPLKQALSSPSAPEVAPQPDAIRPQSQQIPAQIPQVAPLTDNTRFFHPSATGGPLGRDRGIAYQTIVESAQSKGMTPDELIQKAGLQRADVSASLLPDPRDRDLARRT